MLKRFFLLLLWTLPLYGIEEGVIIEKNIQENQRGPRIALITFVSAPEDTHAGECYEDATGKCYPYEDIVQFGTRSKSLYCEKNGYDFIRGTKKLSHCRGEASLNPLPLSAHWMKVALMGNYLDQYDWVFWSDADSVILNPDIRLESFIDKYAQPVLFGTEWGDARNSGQIFIKNSPQGIEFLTNWWLYSINSRDASSTWDQECLSGMIQDRPDLGSLIVMIPSKQINCAAFDFELGDFIVHFYGHHGKELYEIFQEFEVKYGYILDDLAASLKE